MQMFREKMSGKKRVKRCDCYLSNLPVGVPQQVSLQGVQTRQRVCNDLSFVVRIRVLDKVLDSREHRGFRFTDSKAKFYRIVFNEGVGVKSVPFGLIHITPQVLNVRHHNVPKAEKYDYTVYPVWTAVNAIGQGRQRSMKAASSEYTL
jgi:hypothetical protein